MDTENAAPIDRVPTYSHPGFHGVIGTAQADITPPVGIYSRNWGAAQHDVASTIHRPLVCTVLTICENPGDPPLVLASLDLGWWRSYKDEWYVRKHLLDALGISSARLLISFSHTHAGPVLCREDASKPGGEHIAPYLDFLKSALQTTIQSSLASAVPAVLEWRAGVCGLARNRDLQDPDSERILLGFNPEEEADQTLLVGRATSDDGRVIATLINYACHPTTLAHENVAISPDFVGAARDLVQAQYEGAPCLFLQGASGELAPRRQYTGDTAVADANGRELGYAALSVLAGMNPAGTMQTYAGAVESGAPLGIWVDKRTTPTGNLKAHQIDVELPLQEMPSLAALDALIAGCADRVALERLSRKRRIREAVGDGKSTHMPLWLWELGDAILIAHPNEAYSALQTSLRAAYPDKAIVVLNVTNGHFGYLPPAHLYEAEIYSVWQSPFGPGCLEHLIETAEHRIKELVNG
jgi:hypothetical protein